MTSNQQLMLLSLLTTLSLVNTPEQIDIVWLSLSALAKQLGINIGTKPTSIPQARAVANSLRTRYSN